MADGLQDAAAFYGSAPEVEAALEVPPLPESLQELWATFWRLCLTRPRTEGGFGPILFAEVNSYCRLYGVRFTAWELETLSALDALWVKEQMQWAKELKEKRDASR